MYATGRKKSRNFLLLICLLLKPLSLLALPVEEQIRQEKEKLFEMDQSLPVSNKRLFRRTPFRDRTGLSPLVKEPYHRWLTIQQRLRRLETIQRLKQALLHLPSGKEGPSEEEAERLAEGMVVRIDRLRAEYRMVRPAPLHNFLIHAGLRKEGLCWQWTRELNAQFEEGRFQRFESHWGVARPDTFREHNALVITRPGEPFESGLVIDGWRRSGSPFWAPVTQDKYPWTELKEAL